MEEHSEKNYEVGQSYQVYITHIKNPHSFYVRLVKFDDLLQELEKPGDPVEKLGKDMNVVYTSPTSLNHYVRGIITGIKNGDNDDQQCEIYAVDYGHTDVGIHIDNIRMPDNTREVSPLAIQCELHLCAPKERAGFSEKAIDAMKYYIGTEVSKMTVMNKTLGKLSVQLKNSCPDDIATLLALTEFTSLGMPFVSVNKNKINSSVTPQVEFKCTETKAGDVFHVRVQGGIKMSAFYVAQVQDFKKFRGSEQRDLNSYSKYLPSVTELHLGEFVGVMYDSQHRCERAYVKQIIDPGSKALVQLLEWGKEEVVSYSNIKKLKTETFGQTPAQALYCSADESQVWDNRLQKFLYPGYEFKIKIIKAGIGFDEPNQVELIRLKNF